MISHKTHTQTGGTRRLKYDYKAKKKKTEYHIKVLIDYHII